MDYASFDNVKLKKRISPSPANDFRILQAIVKAIFDYRANRSDLRSTLMLIGELAGGISYSNVNDKDNRHIRNKYGYIRRNKNKSINEKGIHFERLYHLKMVLRRDASLLSVPNKTSDAKLRRSLFALIQKIAHIFKEEGTSLANLFLLFCTKADFSASIADLTAFSWSHCEPMLVEKLHEELERWTEDLKIITIDFSIETDRYYVGCVFCTIGEVIKELCGGGIAVEEDENEVKDGESEVKGGDIEIKGRKIITATFRGLIKLRYAFVYSHSEVNQLRQLSEYEMITSLIDAVMRHFRAVIVHNIDNGTMRYSIDYDYTEAAAFQRDVKELLKLIGRDTAKECNKAISILDGFVGKAFGIIIAEQNECEKAEAKSAKGKAKSTVDQRLSCLNGRYRVALKDCSSSIAGSVIALRRYPPSLHMDHREAIEKCVEWTQSRPTQSEGNATKLRLKIEALKAEGKFLINMIQWKDKLQSISERKHRYIVQHIMLIIEQSRRDILQRVPNSRLRHNPFVFNNDQSDKALRELMMAFPQLKSPLEKTSSSDDPESVESLRMNALSLYYLRMYGAAIVCINEAIELCQSQCVLQKSDVSDDEYKRVIGMDRSVYRHKSALVLIYYCKGKFIEAYAVLQRIIERIESVDTARCTAAMNEVIADIYGDAYFPLRMQGKHAEANEALKKADFISKGFAIKAYLAALYVKIGENDAAEALCHNVIEGCTENVHNILALDTLMSICIAQKDRPNRMSDIEKCIYEMEERLRVNSAVCKMRFHHECALSLCLVVNAKLYLIIVNLMENERESPTEYERTKLLEIEVQFNDIHKKGEWQCQRDSRFTDTYLLFCYLFAMFYVKDIHLHPNGDDMMKAAKYFDWAMKSFPLLWERPSCTTDILEETLQWLPRAYIAALSYGELTGEMKRQYSRKLYNLQDEHESIIIKTLSAIPIEYMTKGAQSSGKHDANTYGGFTDAVKHFQLIIDLLRKEKSVRKAVVNEAKMRVALWYFLISLTQDELRFTVDSLSYYAGLSALHLYGETASAAREGNTITEKRLTDMVRVLCDIYEGKPTVIIQNEYIKEYLQNKFNLRIVIEGRTWQWCRPDHLSVDDLRNQILAEMDNDALRQFLLPNFCELLSLR